MNTGGTVRENLTETASNLACVSGDDADFEAHELLCFVLGRDRLLYTDREKFLTPEQKNLLEKLIKRRLAREPLQYILGTWEFMGLPFKVSPSALIPRQDTETLCEEAEKFINRKHSESLLDICTGTGCIGISLALRCNIEVTLADISSECLGLAEQNALLNGISCKIIQSDLFSDIDGRFDIITANPPYIASDVIKTLSPEVRREPVSALDGGADGLDFYRRMAEDFRHYLNAGGVFLTEIGFDQGKAVSEIFKSCGKTTLKQDICGNDRVIIVET